MEAENFGERMRDRMPAHRVWRARGEVTGMSRQAEDLMWEELRQRLRQANFGRSGGEPDGPLQFLQDRISETNPRSVGLVVVGASLVGLAVFALFL